MTARDSNEGYISECVLSRRLRRTFLTVAEFGASINTTTSPELLKKALPKIKLDVNGVIDSDSELIDGIDMGL